MNCFDLRLIRFANDPKRNRATIFRCYSAKKGQTWPTLLLMIAAFALGLAQPGTSWGQSGQEAAFGTIGGFEPRNQYPAPEFYLAMEIYRSGDLKNATNAFEAALRSGRKDIHGRWIDSIPSLAMLAECYWQLGNVPAAKDFTDQVFQIAIRNRGWLGRIDWQSSIQNNVVRAKPSYLWPEAAAINVAPVSERMMFVSGEQLTPQSLVRGGAIEEINVRAMDMVEIMRGLTIASYRRRVLLGPLAKDDAMAIALLEATKFPADLQVPIGRSLIGSVRTAEYFSTHDDKRVVTEAMRMATLGGSVHPMSHLVGLCHASTMAASDPSVAVIPIAINVANAAAALEQPEWVGEAMQLAAGCASAKEAPAVVRASTIAAAALHRQSRLATLHCLIAAADASVTAGNLDVASQLIGDAKTLSNRRDVFQPRLLAYGAYVMARLSTARGVSFGVEKPTELDQAYSQIQTFALNHRDRNRALVSSPRLFQLGLIRQAIGKSIGAKTSDELLEAYCQDPPIELWRRDPVDALAATMVDRSQLHAARVQLAAAGGYSEKMLQAADQMLAARFLQQLPLGGRLAHVRGIAIADEKQLEPDQLEFRRQAGPAMDALRAAAAKPGPSIAELETLESKASGLAIQRMQLPSAALPLLDRKLPVAKIPKRTGVLSFFYSGKNLFATFAADGKVASWNVAGSNRLPIEIGKLLREFGVGKPRGKRLPEDENWKATALALRQRLMPDETMISADRFDELIVVPDGPLWYLPMELFPSIVSGEGAEDSPRLGDQLWIRYAATPGLAIKPIRHPETLSTIGITTDNFFAPRDLEFNQAIVESIVEGLDNPVRLPQHLPTPSSLLGDKVGFFVVAAAVPVDTKQPLKSNLAKYDSGTSFGSLDDWLRFPAVVPRSVTMMGMRTPVDVGQMGSGEEVFMTLAALQAAGVNDVILSRWAVGGESTAILLREYLQELPLIGMRKSWDRARKVLRQTQLDPTAEPLLTKAEHDLESLSGNQPLFWAGYLVSSPAPIQP